MAKKGILDNQAFRIFIEVVTLTVGFFLLSFCINSGIIFENVWNARAISVGIILIICVGFAYGGGNSEERLFRFFISGFVLFGLWFGLGTALLFNDVANDTTYTEGSGVLVAFDILAGIGYDVKLITQSVVMAIPSGVMLFSIITIFRAKGSDEWQNALIEAGSGFALLLGYGWVGSMFGWLVSLQFVYIDFARNIVEIRTVIIQLIPRNLKIMCLALN